MNLLENGQKKIQWVRNNMPILKHIENRLLQEKPFKGLTMAVCIHLEAKTARLAEVLMNGGASVHLAGSNTLSTQDDVTLAISEKGIHTYAKHGCSEEEYENYLDQMIQHKPSIIIDDGGDLTHHLHEYYPSFCKEMVGGCEETTTGVIRLKARQQNHTLGIPMILVNDAKSKYLFDNRYGTGQSVWTSIMSITNLIVAGKTVVIAGYGWCGKGVALRAKALGAKVIITEIDPIKAVEAHMDGFQVMTMEKAAYKGDFFVTVTGCSEVISSPHFSSLKNGAILCNAGHFNVEVDMPALETEAVCKKKVRQHVVEYTLANGNTINVIADGKLVNLASGDGHPAEIMDLSFALQVLSAEYLLHNHLSVGIYNVPHDIDKEVSRIKLKTLGIDIDDLTPIQREYLQSFR